MSLLLFLASAVGGGPPPDPRQGLTRLGLGAVPTRHYGTFPNRNPQTVLTLDPALLTWTGQPLNAPLRLALAPADLRWIGLYVPGQRYTQLGLLAVPARHYGSFAPRALATLLVLEPGAFTWVGQFLVIPEDQLQPADWTWQGQELVVRDRTLRAWTAIGLTATPSRRYPAMTGRDGAVADGADLTWQGQDVHIQEVIRLDPMDLTWQGQNVPDRRVLGGRDRELQPLTGVR